MAAVCFGDGFDPELQVLHDLLVLTSKLLVPAHHTTP
jgi:hypothetical protein